MVMSRNRMLPPDIFTDEPLMRLPRDVKLTGLALRLNADDYGRENANSLLLKSSMWPLDEEITPAVIEDQLLQLEAANYIGLYVVDGRTYYAMADWPSVSHPSPQSRIPAPPADLFRKSSGASLEGLSAVEGERKSEREGRGESREERPAGVPPEPFCSKHPDGTETPCGPCGTARRRHDLWVKARERETEEAMFDEAGV